MAHDRQRVQRVSDRTTVTEIMYSVRLGPLFCLNGQLWKTAVCWEDYKGRHNQVSVVLYDHANFQEDMGRWKRNKRQTWFYKNEKEPERGVKPVKARFDSNSNPCKTSNKEYSNIIKTLEYNNMSNENACKNMAEIEDILNCVEDGRI